MSAPLDRAYVQILPDLRQFNKDLSDDVSKSVKQAGADIDKVNEQVAGHANNLAKSSGGLLSSVKNSVKSLVSFAAPALAGVGIFETLKSSYVLAQELIKTTAQTAAVIKSTGGAAHVTAKEVQEYTTSLSNQTGVQQSVIQANANMLLTFTGVRNEVGKGNDIFNQATKTVLDMSVALKEDGKNAAIQLGKALNDPIKGVTALARVGVTFTAQQKLQIKAMVDSGHSMAAQKLILGELNREFGGSAAAQETTTDKLKNVWVNFREELGTKLMPVINTVAGRIGKFLTGVMSGSSSVGKALHNVFKDVSDFFSGFTKGTDELGSAQSSFAQYGAVVYQTLNTLYHVLKPLVTELIHFAQDAWKGLLVILRNALPVIQSIAAWMSKHVTLIKTLLVVILAMIAGWKIYVAISKAVAAVTAVINAVMDANPITLVVIAIAALAAGFIYAYTHSKTFRDVIKDVFGFLKTAATDVVNFFKTWGTVMLAVLFPVIGIPLLIWQHWSQIINFLHQVWDSVWNFLRQWGPLILAVLAPVIGLPLLIWQHWSQIVKFVAKVWDDVLTFFKTIPTKLLKLGEHLWDWVLTLLQLEWRGAQIIWNTIITFVKAVPKTVARVGSTIWNWVTSLLMKTTRDVRDGWNKMISWIAGIPGKISAVAAHMWDGIVSAARDAFNGIADIWNNSVGSLSFKIPGWVPVLGGDKFSMPQIPTFHATGGMTLGPHLAGVGDNPSGNELIAPMDSPKTINLLANAISKATKLPRLTHPDAPHFTPNVWHHDPRISQLVDLLEKYANRPVELHSNGTKLAQTVNDQNKTLVRRT